MTYRVVILGPFLVKPTDHKVRQAVNSLFRQTVWPDFHRLDGSWVGLRRLQSVLGLVIEELFPWSWQNPDRCPYVCGNRHLRKQDVLHLNRQSPPTTLPASSEQREGSRW